MLHISGIQWVVADPRLTRNSSDHSESKSLAAPSGVECICDGCVTECDRFATKLSREGRLTDQLAVAKPETIITTFAAELGRLLSASMSSLRILMSNGGLEGRDRIAILV